MGSRAKEAAIFGTAAKALSAADKKIGEVHEALQELVYSYSPTCKQNELWYRGNLAAIQAALRSVLEKLQEDEEYWANYE